MQTISIPDSTILNPLLLPEALRLQFEVIGRNPVNESRHFSIRNIKEEFQSYLADHSEISYLAPSRINDLRYINRFLVETNERLKDGQRFSGFFQTFNARRNESKVNKIWGLNKIYFGVEFLFKRVLPKIKYLNWFYFSITKGRNRLLSKAEVMGRLVCCGFEIENIETRDHMTYFVARKVKEPLHIKNKNYGLLFKMKRVGKNGKLFYVYKLRTMHPFSEFLQDYMIREHGFGSTGKLADDFRMTPWGKVLRKFWIDEFPQLVNLLKGQMKLVGVRPVSQSYFNLLPDDLKAKRIKYKPGLIPPYVALNYESSVNRVLESENKYLDEKSLKPYTTDIRYFFLAMFNIIIRRRRSN